MNDILGDSLTRMRNAIMRGKKETALLKNKVVIEVVKVLQQEDFLGASEESEKEIAVTLLYKGGEAVVANFVRVSKPGQRIYVGNKEILPVMNGRGISIISTSEGIMTGAQAKSKKIGGEFLCKVW